MPRLVRLSALMLAGAMLHGGLASPAAAQTSPPAQPAGPTRLTGVAAWSALIGNTITGTSAGETFSEFFDPTGGVHYVDKDGASTGTWAVRDGAVCFEFPDDDDRTCPAFEVTGTTGTSVETDGSAPVRFEIVPGNPKGL